MEELEKVNKKNKEVIPADVYSKVVSIYNEFVRKYNVLDKDVNIKLEEEDVEVDGSLYPKIKEDAILSRVGEKNIEKERIRLDTLLFPILLFLRRSW